MRKTIVIQPRKTPSKIYPVERVRLFTDGMYFVTIHPRPPSSPGYSLSFHDSPCLASQFTLCTNGHECLFGDIVDGEMRLNDVGRIVRDIWNEIPNYYTGFDIHEFVVMPNHIHGIIEIVGAKFIAPEDVESELLFQFDGTNPCVPKQGAINHAPTLGAVVRGFKGRCSNAVNQYRNIKGQSLWQRNYWEHVIRNEESYKKIAEYIKYNSLNWGKDELNNLNAGSD